MKHESIDQYISDLGKAYNSLKDDFNELNRSIEFSSDLLKEKEAQLNAILNTTVDAVIMIDKSGVIRLFNSTAEELFGYSKEEILGQKVNILMPEPHRKNHDKYIERYVNTGEKHIIGSGRDEMAVRKNGEEFPINLAVSETWIGKDLYFTGILRDLTRYRELETKRRDLENELAESQKVELIGTLIAQFIHDIRSFLTPIAGFSEILSETIPKEDTKAHESLDQIVKATKKAEELANQLMAFVRKGEMGAPDTPSPIYPVINNIRDLIRASVPKTIHIEYNLEEFNEKIPLEALHIQQVIMNLCLNARDAIDKHGTITISLKKQDNKAVLSVTDDGGGMSEETKSHVLEPLFSTKPIGKGTGLGLSIVKNMMDKIEGSIQIDSEEGKGTTITLVFPFSQSS